MAGDDVAYPLERRPQEPDACRIAKFARCRPVATACWWLDDQATIAADSSRPDAPVSRKADGCRRCGAKVRKAGLAQARAARQHRAADNARMQSLIRHACLVCVAIVAAATATLAPAATSATATAAAVETLVLALDGHQVSLDVYPPSGPMRGAAILSHGFTRSRTTLAGHAQALADAGVLVLTPDLPCTFDFRCNARALAALVGLLQAGGPIGPPVQRVMLVGFSAGGLSSLLAASTPGVVGFVGLDPFDRAMPGETERLGLAAARRLHTEALLLRAPASRCNAEAVAAPWGSVLPALWRDELIAGASHCDFESPSDWMCRLACGDTQPSHQQRVRQALLDAAARWLR